jgi:PPK2 family polyphosphate:nucleotide phosphotransferase
VRCVSFRAPSIDEKEHDYLWRVHREVPPAGFIALFNRSHYEDVLVPAVHGQITDQEILQRYRHIREFERMLHDTGTVLMKFFLHISPEEQKNRLQARLSNGEKHWKVDLNDLKERKHWTDYQKYYESAIEATNTEEAPWYVIPSDSKTHRNLAVASIMVEVMQAMELRYPPPNPDYFSIQVE